MKKNAITIIIAAVLLVIFVLLLFTFQVPQSQVVVVSRFQEPIRTISEPGLCFKWPWPIDSINRFDQRVQVFEDQFSETYLADKNELLTSVYVGWRISNAKDFFPKFPGGSALAAQQALQKIIGDAKSTVMSRYSLPDLVNSDATKLKFDEIESSMQKAVETQLDQNNYGISVEFLRLKRIGLPETVTQTAFERMKRERAKYVTQAESEGTKEAEIIKAEAQGDASKLIAEANATAIRIQSEGEAEAAQMLGVFEQNPDLAVFQLELEAVKKSLGQKTTLILDETKPPFDIFNKLTAAPATK
jgi:membrane protease subunit HflC